MKTIDTYTDGYTNISAGDLYINSGTDSSISSSGTITISDGFSSTMAAPLSAYWDASSSSSIASPPHISSGVISVTDTYRQNINKLKEELGDIKKEMSDLKDYFDEKEVQNDMNTMNKANKVYKDLKKNIVDLEKTIGDLTVTASDAIDKANLLETRLADVEAEYKYKLDDLCTRVSALEWEARSK